MITATARDRDHASFWCNFPLFEMSPGLTMSDGLTSWLTRQFAWGIRNIFLGAYVSAHTVLRERAESRAGNREPEVSKR
jgi:hypothetical protein